MPYVYLLRCAGGSFYTGWTADLTTRLAAHQAGRGSRYTRSRRPVTLAYWEELPTESAARRREPQIKRLSHAAKERLCRPSAATGARPEAAPNAADGEPSARTYEPASLGGGPA